MDYRQRLDLAERNVATLKAQLDDPNVPLEQVRVAAEIVRADVELVLARALVDFVESGPKSGPPVDEPVA